MPAATVEVRQGEPGAFGPQTFADESDRARLSAVALKAFLALMNAWDLSNAEAAALLGVSASTFDRMKRGYRPTLSQDQLTRAPPWLAFTRASLLFADDGGRMGATAQ